MIYGRALALVTGLQDGTDDELLEAWQVLVDSGQVWLLPGSIGRMAQALIDTGMIRPPKTQRPETTP